MTSKYYFFKDLSDGYQSENCFKMEFLNGILLRWSKSAVNNRSSCPKKESNILDLPDHPLEQICQCLLGNVSVKDNFQNIANFRATCSRFQDIASRSKLKFPVTVQSDGEDEFVRIRLTRGYLRSWCSDNRKSVPETFLGLLNEQMNSWKCCLIEIADLSEIECLLTVLVKYSNIFYRSVEVVRFRNIDQISFSDMTKFIDVGLESFLAPAFHFEIFSSLVLADYKVHPFIAERCYVLGLFTYGDVGWAFQGREILEPDFGPEFRQESIQRTNLGKCFLQFTQLYDLL